MGEPNGRRAGTQVSRAGQNPEDAQSAVAAGKLSELMWSWFSL